MNVVSTALLLGKRLGGHQGRSRIWEKIKISGFFRELNHSPSAVQSAAYSRVTVFFSSKNLVKASKFQAPELWRESSHLLSPAVHVQFADKFSFLPADVSFLQDQHLFGLFYKLKYLLSVYEARTQFLIYFQSSF